jgi:tetratricopeptide (TPR) repeat protein
MENAGKVRQAKTLHRGGRLAEAEVLYREALRDVPDQLDALEGLGVLSFSQGRIEEARACFAQGVALRPGLARFRANLAEALRVLGRLGDAEREARQALAQNPRLPQTWNTLALLAHEQKRYADAQSACEEAIRLDPRFTAAHINLGNALMAQGRRVQAAAALREALKIEPDNLTAHTNLGEALTELGDPDLLEEAEAHARRAAELAPQSPEVLENLGHVQGRQGRLNEAIESYKQALAVAPRRVASRRSIGELLQQSGRYEDAARFLRSALTLDPRDARTHAAIGTLAFSRERYEEAATHYKAATALDPTLAEAHYGLGLALQECDQPESAEACYREAARVDPMLPTPWIALARLQSERGLVDESCATARQALAMRPNLAEAYWRLATNLKGALPAADIDAMKGLVDHKYLSHGLRAALHFGLGTVYDAQRAYSEAAAHLNAANALQASVKTSKGQAYNASQHSTSIDRLLAVFSPEFAEERRDWGDPDERPVFVVGLPRSGTTLVEQILASHSRVYGAGELRDAINLFNSLPQIVGQPAADPFDCITALGSLAARALARKYVARLDALAPQGTLRIVDKMPDNFKLLGLIALLWPKAHVILCSRDLRDIAVSCWQTSFSSNPWTNTWEDMAQRFADHERMLAHWKRTPPLQWLDVVYEELVADLEGHARRLIDFVGLDWEPNCLEFHKTPRQVRTASQLQVREPVYGRSVGRWRNYESMLEPLIEALRRHGVVLSESHREIREPEGPAATSRPAPGGA